MRRGISHRMFCQRFMLVVLMLLFVVGLFLWTTSGDYAYPPNQPGETEVFAAAYRAYLTLDTDNGHMITWDDNAENEALITNEPQIGDIIGDANDEPLPTEEPTDNRVWDLIGVNDVVFQPETDPADARASLPSDFIAEADMDKLRDFDYLRTQFYLVDKDTGLLPADVDADRFLNASLTADTKGSGPKILVFHTHSNEMYVDSDPNDPMTGVMGAGRLLAELLTNQYGVETLHHTGRYDIVNGKSQIPGAYERMEPEIEKILQDNPSIQIVIDLHRDGLREGIPPMVTEINGERVARIMFINGLSRIERDGALVAVSGLPNPHITENFAFSFQMQLTANRLYPGFARKIYLKPYRYSLHMMPLSTLVEIGAQNNTLAEALNAMPPLAEILASVALR